MAKTRDFAEVIKRRLANDPELAELVEDAAFNARLAQLVYDARTEAGLTQAQLAQKAGTHQSVIARIEDADYGVRSIRLLKRISRALGRQLHFELYPGPSYLMADGLTQATVGQFSWTTKKTSEDTWNPVVILRKTVVTAG